MSTLLRATSSPRMLQNLNWSSVSYLQRLSPITSTSWMRNPSSLSEEALEVSTYQVTTSSSYLHIENLKGAESSNQSPNILKQHVIWDIGKYVPTAPVLQESFDAINALLCIVWKKKMPLQQRTDISPNAMANQAVYLNLHSSINST